MSIYLYDALEVQGMYDAIHTFLSPDDIVASYIDHPEVQPPCMQELARLFPNNARVGISAHGNAAMIIDCESGAVIPENVPGVITASRAAGYQVTVYASLSNWNQVVAACRAQFIALPLWWEVNRGPAVIRAGTVGNQYLGAGPYDKSVITDEWAAILRGAPSPSGGGQPLPSGDNELNTTESQYLTDIHGAAARNEASLVKLLQYLIGQDEQGGLSQPPSGRSTAYSVDLSYDAINAIQASVNLLPAEVVAALPATTATNIQPLLDAINAQPAAVIAALKAAL